MTDTDEARRRRSEAARKGALARSPESRRPAARKASVTKGSEDWRLAALKRPGATASLLEQSAS